MKLGFISNCYAPRTHGGAERVMQSLAEACRDEGHDPFVITLGADGADSVDEVGGVRVHRLFTRNVYWPFEPDASRNALQKAVFHTRDLVNRDAASAVAKVVADEGADLVSTHNLSGFSVAVWDALDRIGVPVVHTLHDYHLMCVKTTRFRGAVCDGVCPPCRFASVPRRWASQGVSAVVGVSRHVLDTHLRDGYFAGVPSAVVANGYPVAGGRPVARPAGAPLRLGFVGRVEQTKGIELLLSALALRPDMDLRLIVGGRGDPAYLKALKARYPDPRVEWLGYVDSNQVYRTIDALVVPSLWEETFGGVIVEAWEWGLPAVVAAHGGMNELIMDGVTGIRFSPGDAGALAAAIDRVAQGELAHVWQVQARLDARSRLMPARMARQMLDLFESVLERDRIASDG